MAFHAVLSRPHVARRLEELVVAHVRLVRPDPRDLEGLLQGIDPGSIPGLSQIMGDPSFLGESDRDPSPELERVRSQLAALTAAIAGYAEYVTSVVASRLIGGHAPIGEAMRRRRVGRGEGERVAESFFGLHLDQEDIDRGGGVRAKECSSGPVSWRSGPALDRRGPAPADPGRDGRSRALARPHQPRLGRHQVIGHACRSGEHDLFFGHTEVPLQYEVLPLGVANDAFPVPPELRVVGRQSTRRARARWRNSSMTARSPNSDSTSQWGRRGRDRPSARGPAGARPAGAPLADKCHRLSLPNNGATVPGGLRHGVVARRPRWCSRPDGWWRIWAATVRISSTAIAKPTFWAGALPCELVATAVFIATTCPEALTSGPPELPGLMGASVWIKPLNLSVVPSSVVAVSDLLRAETIPSVTVSPPASAERVPDGEDGVSLLGGAGVA